MASNCTSSTQSRGRKRKSQQTQSTSSKTKKPTQEISDLTSDQSQYTSVKHISKNVKKDNAERLDYSFFDVPCEDLAEALLGQTIVRICDGKRLSGKIVETEAYLGSIDKAAHSYKGKKTDKNTAMFMPPGTAYVYNIYGMYCCINISSKGDGAAVLIRALQPLDNLETMDEFRTKGKDGNSFLKKEGVGLCNGPSKLCQSLNIKKDSINKLDMCTSDQIWLEKNDTVCKDAIVKCKRINIGYAEDWVDKPLRFYILGNKYVSVRDKPAENEMSTK
ncbi:hypothetical protein ACF0H5_000488 [Mactra antiquata]